MESLQSHFTFDTDIFCVNFFAVKFTQFWTVLRQIIEYKPFLIKVLETIVNLKKNHNLSYGKMLSGQPGL